MATLNIYLSEILKTEMDATPTSTNWSGICQNAIQQELTRLAAIQGTTSAIVARLRATGSKQYKSGYAAGKTYAAEHATIDDFEGIMDWYHTVWDKVGANNDMNVAVKSLTGFLGVNEEYFAIDDPRTYRWINGFTKAMKDTWEIVQSADTDDIDEPIL